MSKIENIKSIVTKSKTNLFIGLAICCLIVDIIFDFFDSDFSFHDILVESHGLVFDLFIFGILLTTYETISAKKEKIERYKEELDDYKFWQSEESMYRTRGLIKRLVDLGESNLDISFCYLASDKSLGQYRDMTNWKFAGATLTEGFFCHCNMTNANFYLARLQDATFDQTNLTNCNFGATNLLNTSFEKCDLTNTKFDGAIVISENWFDKLESEKNINVDILRSKYFLAENIHENNFKYYTITER